MALSNLSSVAALLAQTSKTHAFSLTQSFAASPAQNGKLRNQVLHHRYRCKAISTPAAVAEADTAAVRQAVTLLNSRCKCSLRCRCSKATVVVDIVSCVLRANRGLDKLLTCPCNGHARRATWLWTAAGLSLSEEIVLALRECDGIATGESKEDIRLEASWRVDADGHDRTGVLEQYWPMFR